MNIYVYGFKSSYEQEHLTRIFYPKAGIARGMVAKGEDCAVFWLGKYKTAFAIRQAGRGSAVILKNNAKTEKEASETLCLAAYRKLREFTGMRPAWGALTGVRPVRLIRDMRAAGKTDKQIEERFLKHFDVSNAKFELCRQTANAQEKAVSEYNKRDCSIYISIPFCPSRCSYCSFVSKTTEKSAYEIQPYTDLLCREIAEIGDIVRRNGLIVKTVYIGGGTPTSLSANQLESVMRAVADNIDINAAQEYTVEAGRPDCTTPEKLEIIKSLGATRLSINPQTLNNEVLKNIGRRHTAEDIITCYNAARAAGHKNINMDLIAGLPGDTVQSFENSLNGVIAICPENITVHTLTLKRASNLVIDKLNSEYDDVAQMLKKEERLLQSGYYPYYLYRQKGTLQNLENTGFTRKGFEGLYNIYIMEEIHTILSAGAGGVTKLKAPGVTERIFNFKYPHEYISGFEDIIKRKERITEFYGSYLDT